MFEWLDGYWTAIHHAATLRIWLDSPDWAAMGSMLAGVSAAIAAYLSFKVAKDTQRDAIEKERGAVLLVSQEQTRILSSQSQSVAKEWVEFGRKSKKLTRRSAGWISLSEEFLEVQTAFMSLSESSDVDKKLIAAKSLKEILLIRSELGAIWMKAHRAEKSFDALKFRSTCYLEDNNTADLTN